MCVFKRTVLYVCVFVFETAACPPNRTQMGVYYRKGRVGGEVMASMCWWRAFQKVLWPWLRLRSMCVVVLVTEEERQRLRSQVSYLMCFCLLIIPSISWRLHVYMCQGVLFVRDQRVIAAARLQESSRIQG